MLEQPARSGRRFVVLMVAALVALAVAMPPTGADAATGIDRTSRSAVVSAYKNQLLPALQTSAAFSGSVSSCVPGQETQASRTATMAAVNYYRAMAGLPAVVNNPDWNDEAQAAALIMDANNNLSHYPSEYWECHTPEGELGAARSNISLGVAGAKAVEAYMIDYGPTNAAVGHRRWILYPPNVRVGTGSTPRANALYLLEDDMGAYGPRPSGVDWVAWPPGAPAAEPAMYVPWEALPHRDAAKTLFRWSLSSNTMPNADYSTATVAMKFGTEALIVEPEWVEDGAGDNALVWNARRANGARFPIEGDATFTVTVSGIKNAGAAVQPRTYTVNAVRAVPDTAAPPAPGFVGARGKIGGADLYWRNLRSDDLRGVELRIQKGTTAPSRTSGRRVCKVAATRDGCSVSNLEPGVRYTISAFAFDYAGNYSRRRTGYIDGTTVTAAAPKSARRGANVRITGSLFHGKPAANTILTNKTVLLHYRLRRDNGTWGAWTLGGVATTTAGPTSYGDYTFKRQVNRTVEFRTSYQGDDYHTGDRSPAKKVTVG